MTQAGLSVPRKIALFSIELLIKLLWVLDRVTSFDIGYTLKFFSRVFVFLVSVFFLMFLGYSISTGYLHKILVAYTVPGNISSKSVAISYPILVGTEPSPEISALSAIAVDKDKITVLYEKNPDEKLQPASTVKLMSSIISLGIYNLEDELIVSDSCTQVEGTKAFLPKETSYKVKDLIEAMMVGSAGDSACILASSKIDEDTFVELMNEKAASIGMDSSSFSNPIGLDDFNGNHYSSARDLYKLAVYATSFDEIRKYVSKSDMVLDSVDGSYKVYLPNTNRFLWEVPNTVGIKTGTTQGAGEVLIYEYDDGVKDIIIVVMGSADRFSDTKLILDWVLGNYRWED